MKRLILFFLIALLLMSPVLAYSVPDDTIVYVTPSGTKYHREDCTYTTSTSSLTIQEAEARGYEPCSRCSPNVLRGEYIPPDTSHSASGSGSSSHSTTPPNHVKDPVDPDKFETAIDVDPIEDLVEASTPSSNPGESSKDVEHSASPQSTTTPINESQDSLTLSALLNRFLNGARNVGIFVGSLLFLISPLLPYLLFKSVHLTIRLIQKLRFVHSKKSVPPSAPQDPPVAPPPQSPPPIMVYFSLHAKVFHRENCGCLSRSKHVVGATITYAFNHQMTPCKICRPMDLVTSYEYVRWQDILDQSSIQTPDDPVYFPLSGIFYHEKSCPILQHQPNIVSADLRTAVLRNKRQCPVCKPVRRVPIKYSLSAPID